MCSLVNEAGSFPDTTIISLTPQASEGVIYSLPASSHAVIGGIIKGYYVVCSYLFLLSFLKIHPTLCSLLSEASLFSPLLQIADPMTLFLAIFMF